MEENLNIFVKRALEHVVYTAIMEGSCSSVNIICYFKGGPCYDNKTCFSRNLGPYGINDCFAIDLLTDSAKAGYVPERLFLADIVPDEELDSNLYTATLYYLGSPTENNFKGKPRIV